MPYQNPINIKALLQNTLHEHGFKLNDKIIKKNESIMQVSLPFERMVSYIQTQL